MKVVIIGGAAGGASLATRLRRLEEKVQLTIIEQNPSPSYAGCALPYYLGGEVAGVEDMYVADAKLLDSRYRIRVKCNSRAVSIDPKEKCVYIKNILGQSDRVYYDKLVIATGSRAVLPPFAEGKAGVFALKRVEDSVALKAYILEHEVKEAVVVGGGFIGLETCENLSHLGISVTLLEKAPQVLMPLDEEMAGYLHHELRANGVKLLLNTGIADLKEENGVLTVVTEAGDELKTSLVVMAAGVRPNTEIARDCGIKINERGFIVVDEHLATSLPEIYALGDAVVLDRAAEDRYAMLALASPAQKQSRILAAVLSEIARGEQGDVSKVKGYQGAVGTSIVRCFNLTAGSSGFNLRALKDRENVESVTVHAAQHVSWFTGSTPVHLKLIFDRKNGEILGAQAVGAKDIDKALEVLSLALEKHCTVYDLIDLESAYAPPFSGPRSPVNMAGSAAANIIEGLTEVTSCDKLSGFDPDKTVFLDVRSPEEYSQGSIPGFINAQLEKLRVMIGMGELDKSKTYVVTCQVGVRGFIACCILKGSGFEKVYNLSGGYVSWKNYEENLLNQ